MIYRYFLALCELSFHPLNSIFQRTKFLNVDEVQFINVFFTDHALAILPKKLWSSSVSKTFSCYFLLTSVTVLGFTFRSTILSNYFLYMEPDMDLSSFFTYDYPIAPVPFVENSLFRQIAFAPLLKINLQYVWIYSWTLYSTELLYLSSC